MYTPVRALSGIDPSRSRENMQWCSGTALLRWTFMCRHEEIAYSLASISHSVEQAAMQCHPSDVVM